MPVETGQGSWIIEQPWRTAFVDPISINARRILSDISGLKLVDHPDRAELVWVRKGFARLLPHLESHQLLNHFRDESAMINKGRLTGALSSTRPEFYPESYRLSAPDERSAFLDRLPERDDPEQLWIFKPAGLSRGKGIRILWNFGRLKRQLTDPGSGGAELDESLDYIAQRYIRDPLLLDGRKSEIRVYWLIASIDPLMVLLYREGTVRLNNQPYRLDDFDNQLIHVTNTYQQKKHPEFDSTQELKWAFSELDDVLGERLQGKSFVTSRLLPAASSALGEVVRAVRDDLAQPATEAMCFGLYGADLIVDSDLRIWLTEIQKNPGLSHVGDPVKSRVIPDMLREAVSLVLEVRDRKLSGLPLNDLRSRHGFEWILCESS